MLVIKFLICDNETWGSDDWGVGSVDWCKDIWGEEFDRVIGSLLAAAAEEEVGSSFGPWNDILNETKRESTKRMDESETKRKQQEVGSIGVETNWIE